MTTAEPHRDLRAEIAEGQELLRALEARGAELDWLLDLVAASVAERQRTLEAERRATWARLLRRWLPARWQKEPPQATSGASAGPELQDPVLRASVQDIADRASPMAGSYGGQTP